MAESVVPLHRAWNTWDSEFPADMIHLSMGVRLSFCVYAGSKNSFSRFPAGKGGVRLGPRSIDATTVELDLEHAGTALALRYDKAAPFAVRGSWRTIRHGEWGLRFWVVVVARLAPPHQTGGAREWIYDPATAELSARSGDRSVVLRGERPPLLVTFHDDLDDLHREFETKGYFCLDSRGDRGPLAALRYNLDEMPRFSFAAALANDRGLAAESAKTALGGGRSPAPAPMPMQVGRFDGALEAVRDIIGWNTVWDAVNHRPYTTPSRNWVSQKFGGWGIWLNHAFYYAMMSGMFDVGVARENLLVALAGATAQGNLPCLMTGRDAWTDRSQPPLSAFLVWILFQRAGARDLLAQSYQALLRYHDWWWANRDGNGDGLIEYGTSAVGDGLYRGTKLGAKNESSMDNSPVHDEATLDPESLTLDCADVGLNSLLALDGEMLARIAETLGHEADARRLAERSEQLKERIRTRLWDEQRQVFANRLWSGEFVRSVAPTSFYPLLCGAATPAQAEAMAALLSDPTKFGGEWLLPSVTRDDPAFADNVYWRGRIWPPLNYLVWQSLRRYDFAAAAGDLARNSYALFMREWAARNCPENFNATTGAAMDQADTDSFYGWGALMPYIAVAEIVDVGPWNGWEITHGDDDVAIGPVLTPGGMAMVEIGGSCLTLCLDGRRVLRTNAKGPFRHLRFDRCAVEIVVPAIRSPGSWIDLPGVPHSAIVAARLEDGPVDPVAAGGGIRIDLPTSGAPRRLQVFHTGLRASDPSQESPRG